MFQRSSTTMKRQAIALTNKFEVAGCRRTGGMVSVFFLGAACFVLLVVLCAPRDG